MSLCLAVISIPTSLFVLGILALALTASLILASLFAPTPNYHIVGADELPPNDSPHFLNLLEALADARINRTGSAEVFTNGTAFYPAELDAIRNATRSINLEAYIFKKGQIGQLFLDAMTERARAGVKVNIVLDAFGSLGTRMSFFRPLREAGGRVSWYNSPAWYRIIRLGNRTHRELLIIDGSVAFIGGAGIADQWLTGIGKNPMWRDTFVRVEGEAVFSLQATFAENWLASCGELLVGKAYVPPTTASDPHAGHALASLVVNSTPTPGGSTRARVLFQLLLASARHTISITTPYFLPDKSLTGELCRAVERGVTVRILVPGRRADHLLTRSTSQAGYGPLLKAGAEIYEYQPSMIHAKILCVDQLWSVVGSTNFDNRSFGLNDEVNLAVCDASLAARLESDNARDLANSRRVSLEAWRDRPLTHRATEFVGWIFERQQ